MFDTWKKSWISSKRNRERSSPAASAAPADTDTHAGARTSVPEATPPDVDARSSILDPGAVSPEDGPELLPLDSADGSHPPKRRKMRHTPAPSPIPAHGDPAALALGSTTLNVTQPLDANALLSISAHLHNSTSLSPVYHSSSLTVGTPSSHRSVFQSRG